MEAERASMSVNESKMKTTTKKSGIGRRRGAKTQKSLQTSIIVSLVAFCITFFVIMGLYLASMPSRQDQIRASREVYMDAPFLDRTAKFLKHRHERDVERNVIEADSGEVERDVKDYLLDKKLGPILRAEVDLFDLEITRVRPDSSTSGGYAGIKARFCKLNWKNQKMDPPKMPMFRFLIEDSACHDPSNVIKVELSSLIDKVRQYDQQMHQDAESNVHAIPPTGFVFHESRVGSTLVANTLTAMDPDAHRVLSEATHVNWAALTCEDPWDDCDMEMAANIFRDVVYLSGRTNVPTEKRLFFKFSSILTKQMRIILKAFPDTPWIFVYRNPVQTMMSHLDPAKIGPRTTNIMAVCTKARRRPSPELNDLVADFGRDIRDISDYEFCAAHLASLCESALKELRKSSTGKAVEYDGLVDKLIEDVIPHHFGVKMTEEARKRILDVSKIYSKNKGTKKSQWEEDSEKKEQRASKAIVDASDLFLAKSFAELQSFSSDD